MNTPMSESRPSATGEIRVRSNVCTDPRAYHLVPGTLLRSYFPEHLPTPAQRMEQQYLHRCTLCKRNTFEINEEGCDHHICRRQGILSRAEAADRNAERDSRAAAAVEYPTP